MNDYPSPSMPLRRKLLWDRAKALAADANRSPSQRAAAARVMDILWAPYRQTYERQESQPGGGREEI